MIFRNRCSVNVNTLLVMKKISILMALFLSLISACKKDSELERLDDISESSWKGIYYYYNREEFADSIYISFYPDKLSDIAIYEKGSTFVPVSSGDRISYEKTDKTFYWDSSVLRWKVFYIRRISKDEIILESDIESPDWKVIKLERTY